MADTPPRTLPWYITALPLIVLAFLAGSTVSAILFQGKPLPLIISTMLLTQGLATALSLALLYRAVPRGERAAEAFLRRLRWRDAGDLLRYSALMFLLILPLNVLIQLVMHYLGLEPEGNPLLKKIGDAPWSFVLTAAFLAIVVAPVCEEFLFRVVLFRSLENRLGQRLAIVMTSLIFSLVHFIPVHIPGLFVLALLLQVALLRTRHLLVPIIMHAVFNAFAFGMLIVVRLYYPELLDQML